MIFSAPLNKQGQFEEAERLLNASLVGRRKVSGENHSDTLASLKALEALRAARSALPAK
jgi:hypothetical protein